MTTADAPTVRLSSPGDIAAAVPLLCGFVPHDSLVLVALRGKRVAVTLRVDLPPPAQERAAAAELAGRLQQVGASGCALVVLAGRRRPGLVDALLGACEEARLAVSEAIHVADDRWTSYTCSGPCCPATGSPVPEPSARWQAESVLTGRAVLPSRADLVASMAPPALPALARVRQDRAVDALAEQVLARGPEAARRATEQRVRSALDRVREGEPVDAETAAAVGVALHDVPLRDRVAALGVTQGPQLRSLLEQVVRVVGPPDDAPACSVLAWVSYADGDGGAANVALDRALRTDPDYSLALLLRTALDAALPPSQVRAVLSATAAALTTPG